MTDRPTEAWVAAIVEVIESALKLVPPNMRNMVFEESTARVRSKRAKSTSSLGVKIDPRREP